MFHLICKTDLVTEITQGFDCEMFFCEINFYFLVRVMNPHGKIFQAKVKLLSLFF